MIAYLNGILVEKNPSTVIIDVAGVGYEVFIPLSTYDRLPATGSECKIFTHHEVREDAQLLFGFSTQQEKEMFRLLTSVSGVGPKIALAALSGMSIGDIQLSIAESNAKRLSSIKGIGKKMAERIVVELKDKVNPIEAFAQGRADGDIGKANILRDAMLALSALGFTEEVARKQVQQVVSDDPSIADTETIIRKALASK
jgi:Holliday junction DNA helicase RuvA